MSVSTTVLSSDLRSQRLAVRNARQQAAEEQVRQQAEAHALWQARIEAEAARRKRIANKAEKQLLTAIVKLVPAELPQHIDATQNCTICQENFNDAPGHLVETTCQHVFHETCMSSLLSHLPQGANQSQISTQRCPNCYTVIRTLGKWATELEFREGPFNGPDLKRYKRA